MVIERNGEREALPAEAVFLLTGYHPDVELMTARGCRCDPETLAPTSNPETFETNVPNLFLAGGAVAGRNTGSIFIENGRFHGEKIVSVLAERRRRRRESVHRGGVVVLVALACAVWRRTTAMFRDRRLDMIDEQIKARGVTNHVCSTRWGRCRASSSCRRSRCPCLRGLPLPIGQGQTISQPFIVAYMTEVLDVQPAHRVLEIGTGSGYQAAILGELASEVYTIEIVPELARARRDAAVDWDTRSPRPARGTASPAGRSGRPSTASS